MLRLIKTLAPRTLFGRALLIIVAPLVLAQLVAAWVFYDRVWDSVTRRMAAGVAGEIAVVVQTMSRFNDEDSRTWLFDMTADLTGVRATLEEGAILSNTPTEEGSGI